MNQQQKIAKSMPHEFRVKLLMIWLPNAKVNLTDENYKNLWNAYFVYIDPDAVKKENCPKCLNNVYEQWWKMQPYLIEAEKEYNLIRNL